MMRAIANAGTRAVGFHMPIVSVFNLASLAKTVSTLAMPTIFTYLLYNLPVADAKHAKISNGKDDDVYVQCIDTCDKNGKDAHEFAKLLCYAMCLAIDVFKNKK